MKTPECILVTFLFSLGGAVAALTDASTPTAVPSTPTVVSAGPHSRTWSWAEEKTLPDGRVTRQFHGYQELATGLCRPDPTNPLGWSESEETIEILADGAGALRGPYQALFGSDLCASNAVTVILPDGRRVSSTVRGLAYVSADGQRVLVAHLKSCVGELHRPNCVIYRDAFDGVSASVRYTYTRSSFEQDVLLDSLPDPDVPGFVPARLEVITEMFDSPEPTRTVENGPTLGADIDVLDFGPMHIRSGVAYPADTASASAPIPASAEWNKSEGRQFLIESLDYPSLKRALETTKEAKATTKETAAKSPVHAPSREPQLARFFPSLPVRQRASMKPFRLAAGPPPRQGLVLDYQMLSGSLTNFVFASDTTFYISGTLNLYGASNLLCGGAILKFAPAANAQLALADSTANVICLTTNWKPAILTARDMNEVGETINESTGTPSGYYAVNAFNLGTPYAKAIDLHHVRIAYAQSALRLNYATAGATLLRHAQIVSCSNVISGWAANLTLANVLACSMGYSFFNSSSATLLGLNLTLDGAIAMVNGSGVVCLTNSLVANVTNGTYSGANNATVDSSAFKTVGEAAHYLADFSPYRNAGLTNLDSGLLADLRKLTTYAPVLLTNAVTTDTVLSPQAWHDTGDLALGAGYNPIDYLVGGLTVSNCTLLLTNGVTLGVYSNVGLTLQDGSHLISQGLPTSPNRLVRYLASQEQANGIWRGPPSWITFQDDPAASNLAEARFRFTEFRALAWGGSHFAGGSKMGQMVLRDCSLLGGLITWNSDGASGRLLALTNNLFEGVTNTFGTGNDPFTVQAWNNLFKGGSLSVKPAAGNNWAFFNNLFDGVTNSQNANTFTNRWNGYSTNVAVRFNNGLSNIVTNVVYQTGPLSAYYPPSNSPLINRGSTNANLLGFYHLTCTTNQVKETNSFIDIGIHFVALGASGQPVDTDGDGLPDYLEDTDADGVADVGTGDLSHWQQYDSPNGIPGNRLGLEVYTKLK